MTNFNKILDTPYRIDIVCVCGAALHEGELWCPTCKAIAKDEIKAMVHRHIDKSDLIWIFVFGFWAGMFSMILIMSYIVGEYYVS